MSVPALRLLVVAIVSLTVFSCKENRTQYQEPKALNDGWKISTPGKEQLDLDLLRQAVEEAGESKEIDGFIVARHGHLVVDEYFNGYNAEKLHKVWSVTKSVTAALAGIAIEKAFIRSVDDSIGMYLKEYPAASVAGKGSITIEHLLNMSSGINWVEMGGRNSAGYQMAYARDWNEFVLQQAQKTVPGKEFNYSSGNYILLAPIIKNATGEQADEFAAKHLFGPLGITRYEWMKCSEFWTKTEGGEMPSVQKPEPPIAYAEAFRDYPNTASGLKMLPRDMAKLGQLYLDKGQWNGRQVIDEDWIVQSTQPHTGNSEYGYGWRLRKYKLDGNDIDCYYVTGFGLQSIYVFPKLELIVVFTQSNYRNMEEGERRTQNMTENYILKSVKG